MDLSQFKAKAHPTKKIFKQHKIPLSTVSRFLGLSYNHVSSLLNGSIQVTDEIDRRLNELAEALQKEGDKK